MNEQHRRDDGAHANRDPLTDEPGAHPLGTGVGAGVAGAAGAVVGSAAGPLGTAAGAAIGAVAGGLVGKGVAEAINPTEEIEYWRSNFSTRPYAASTRTFAEYEPAYRAGVEKYRSNPGMSWEEAERDLKSDWERSREAADFHWNDAKEAIRDAWHRVADRFRGDRSSAAPGGTRAGSSAEVKDTTRDADAVLMALRDSVEGFRRAAEKAENASYRDAFARLASEREKYVAELKPLVRPGEEAPGGSVLGSLQRGWMSLATALGGGDTAIVNACERAEDDTLEAYRDALGDQALPAPVREVIARQYVHVKDAHDKIRAWQVQRTS